MLNEKLVKFLSCVSLLFGLALWWKLTFGFEEAGFDFIQDYFAASALRAGSSIYHTKFSTFTHPLVQNGVIENYHTPFNAVLFLPMTMLSFSSAFVAWSVLSLLFYALIILLVVGAKRWFPYFSFGLLWFPFLSASGLGQSSLLIAVLLIGGWSALVARWDRLAGVLLAIPCLIKLFPLVLVSFLILTRKWRAFGWWGFTLIAGAGATYLLVGMRDIAHYFTDVARQDFLRFGGLPLNVSLSSIPVALFSESSWMGPLFAIPDWHAALFANVLSLAVLIWGVARARSILAAGSERHAFSLLVVLMVLCSPISWMHIFPVLLLPLETVWQRLRANNNSSLRIVLLLALLLLSVPTDIYLRYLDPRFFAHQGVALLCFFVGKGLTWGLILLAYLISSSASLQGELNIATSVGVRKA